MYIELCTKMWTTPADRAKKPLTRVLVEEVASVGLLVGSLGDSDFGATTVTLKSGIIITTFDSEQWIISRLQAAMPGRWSTSRALATPPATPSEAPSSQAGDGMAATVEGLRREATEAATNLIERAAAAGPTMLSNLLRELYDTASIFDLVDHARRSRPTILADLLRCQDQLND